jgi:peptidoglycan/LPS O-acetylase OafA/YrhL
MQKTESYKAHIDGLRAIAVIGVVLFHLDINVFTGGFVGVDVFFVISGYLITNKIHAEVIKNKRFDFYDFYINRFNRLFPCLVFTLLISYIFGFILFSPDDFEALSGSLLFSLVGFSNFFFWKETGYFDVASDIKPLLHTWSLGVEEQFYLLWPLVCSFIILKFYNKKIIYFLMIGFISFYLNYDVFINESYISKFFIPDINYAGVYLLTPFRIFEFTVGAFLVFINKRLNKERSMNNFLTIIGFLLIIYPMIIFDKETYFPFYNAFFPVIGSAFIIFFGRGDVAKILLENKVMVFIGLISYSFYLIHWPLIVFYKYWFSESLNIVDQSFLFFCSILIAYFMYNFVEKPFRRKKTNKKMSNNKRYSLFLLFVFLSTSSYYTWMNGGMPERLSDELQIVYSEEKSVNTSYNSGTYRNLRFNFTDYDNKKIMIIGDSFGKDLINIFKKSDFYDDVELIYRGIESSCQSLFMVDIYKFEENINPSKIKDCTNQYRELNSSIIDISKADTIFLASAWKNWSIGYIKDAVSNIRKYNSTSKIVVVGRKELEQHVYRSILKPIASESFSVSENDILIDDFLKSESIGSDYIYMSFYEKFCTTKYLCNPFNENNLPIIFDYAHLNERGALYFSNFMKQDLIEYIDL